MSSMEFLHSQHTPSSDTGSANKIGGIEVNIAYIGGKICSIWYTFMVMTLGAICFLMDATVDFFLDVFVSVPFPLTVVTVHI